ncbi:MAG: EAL domain-containing protein [Gammaproteobacteria bacterium]|nr:EAL domain-containing protein [Gammaproteobacteria bacterium]
MKSLSTRIAVVIATVLFALVIVVGVWVESKLTAAIEQQGTEQAELHAQTILGSLKTLMLNGSGTLARSWLGRLQGVAGIKDIEVLRRDGQPAFTDLVTVDQVNAYLGMDAFSREPAGPLVKFEAISPELMAKALGGEVVYDLNAHGQTTIAMPIQADTECLSCHGYDGSMFRGVLKLSLSNEKTINRINEMKTTLWGGAFALIVVLALALWFSLRQNVVHPIRQLRDAINRVSQGDRRTEVRIYRHDEIGQLANSFNSMQKALRDSETRIRAVMDNVVDGIVTLTEDGIIESVNPAVLNIFGYEKSELIGEDVALLTHSDESSDGILGLRDGRELRPLIGLAREVSGVRKSGTTFPMDVAVSEMQVGKDRYFICTLRDITTRKAQMAALRYQALHDALTDLPNRSLFMDRLQQALLTAGREQHEVSILLLDLDRFKEVNDTLGHHVGDKLLQQIAHRLRMILRDSDTVARLGGDEFSVLLPTADKSQAMFIARKIINEVEKSVVLDGQSLSVGASVGISSYPANGDNPVVLMQRADVAMYVAKRSNRGFSIYDAKTDQHSLRQLAINSELRSAIEHNELEVHYQPKIDLKTNRINGFEALVRWRHPKLGVLLPEEFIPLAEQSGLIRPLTMIVLRKSLEESAFFLKKIEKLRLSVNLSMRDLSDLSFADEIASILREYDIPSSRLKFEITETSLMEHPQKTIRALDRLNAMGLRLSIDDFGIGYSALSYLKQLPVNELKIDKSFGMSLVSDGNSAVIVRSTIDMAHELGLSVVAEGIETKEAYEMLQELGCDSVQGFYISRPLPMNEAIKWVEKTEMSGFA